MLLQSCILTNSNIVLFVPSSLSLLDPRLRLPCLKLLNACVESVDPFRQLLLLQHEPLPANTTEQSTYLVLSRNTPRRRLELSTIKHFKCVGPRTLNARRLLDMHIAVLGTEIKHTLDAHIRTQRFCIQDTQHTSFSSLSAFSATLRYPSLSDRNLRFHVLSSRMVSTPLCSGSASIP